MAKYFLYFGKFILLSFAIFMAFLDMSMESFSEYGLYDEMILIKSFPLVDTKYSQENLYMLLLVVFVLAMIASFLWIIILRDSIKTKYVAGVFIISVLIFGYIMNPFIFSPLNKKDKEIISNAYIPIEKQEFKIEDNKKNVVLIFLESIEKTYKDVSNENLIPLISQVAADNISFDGYRQIRGTHYTLSSTVAVFSGIPFNISLGNTKKVFKEKQILSNTDTIIDVYNRFGYNTIFMGGGDLDFMGLKAYLQSAGFDKILAKDEIIEKYSKQFPNIKLENMVCGVHINDKDIYEMAKFELLDLGKIKQPFFFTLSTINGHYPNGVVAKGCDIKDNNIKDAIRCGDKLLSGFLNWLKGQKFYKDTIVVLIGDHLLMDSDISDELLGKKREIANVFINLENLGQKIEKSRDFATFDFAPTILESSGIGISSRRFGIGTSLFSNEKTVLEKIDENEKDLKSLSHPLYDTFF